MIMNVIGASCRTKKGACYPYQRLVGSALFDHAEPCVPFMDVPLRFGTGLVGQVLRPFVYFARPKKHLTLEKFITENPTLGESHTDAGEQVKKLDQRNRSELDKYEMVFDLHEITKNVDTEGKETQPYIDYICAVLRLLQASCAGGNHEAIKRVEAIGLNQEHMLLVLMPDEEKLVIHE